MGDELTGSLTEAEAPALREAGKGERLLGIVAGLVAELQARERVPVTLDSRLDRDLGLDSLSRMELLLRIERELGVSLPEHALPSANTIRDLVAWLGRASPVAIAESRELHRLTEGVSSSPSQAQTLVEVLDWHVAAHPDKLHIHLYGDSETAVDISYRALRDGARAIAAGLAAHGVEPGQSVAIMLPTGKAYLFSFFGTLMAGAVPVPIYPPGRLSQIEDHLTRHAGILANSQARLLITVAEARSLAVFLRAGALSLRETVTVEQLAAHAGSVQPIARAASDLAFLQYTSGSTGNPKGVALTHANLLANIRAMGAAMRVGGEDVFVSWLPLYHDMGLIGAWFGSLYYGVPLALMSPLAFLAHPARWLWAIHRHRGTLSAAPNFAYDICARKLPELQLEGLDLSSWRIAFNGAEPVSADTLDAFARRFAPYGLRREAITPVYGLAECSVGLAFPPLERGPLIDTIAREALVRGGNAVPAAPDDATALRIASCGRPLAGHEIRIVDEAGREAPDRTEGRLQFRGPSATGGYFRNPEQTRTLFDGDWLDSGDFAYVAGGEVYLTGRAKEVIIRGGRHLFPYELEQVVGNIPGIRKGGVAVFGSTDPMSGTERLVVLAETRATDESTRKRLIDEINAAAVDLLGMSADDVVLAPAHTILKTSSGKIRRAASREYYEHRGTHVRAVPVWLQFVRLTAASAAPELRRGLRRIVAAVYAVYAWWAMVLVAVPVWAIVALARKPRLARSVCHSGALLLAKLSGIRITVTGREHLPDVPHILTSNHASYIDPIVVGAALPPAHPYVFVAKREFASQRIARWFLQGLAATFVERSDAAQGVEDAERVEQAARRGASPIFFVEGTFDRQPGLREFRLGAFLVSARTGLPIVPVGIHGARSILRDGTWFPRRGAVAVTIGAPIAPAGNDWAAAVKLRDQVREEILRLSGEPDRVR